MDERTLCPDVARARSLCFTIHAFPEDHPRHIVVRAYDLRNPEPTPLERAWLFTTLGRARDAIGQSKPGAIAWPRQVNDPAPVIETWI